MPDLLRRLAAGSHERVRAARGRSGEILARAARSPEPPALALDGGRFDVIAEVKPASPSAGALAFGDERAVAACARRAARYAEAGACAISVLTEPTAFGGSLELLEGVARAVARPVMRKDVLVDPVQVAEARGAGASGVLLIARVLDDPALAELLAAAHDFGLFAIVEAFDLAELERAAQAAESAAGTVLVGVNARDLATLAVDLARFAALAAHLPSARPAFAESGIVTRDDAARVASLGYRGALIGEALMRPQDPRADLAAMLAAGRAAVPHGEVRR